MVARPAGNHQGVSAAVQKKRVEVGRLRRYSTASRPTSRSPQTRRDSVSKGAVPEAPGSPVFACGDYWLGPCTEQALAAAWRTAREVLQSLGLPVPGDLEAV